MTEMTPSATISVDEFLMPLRNAVLHELDEVTAACSGCPERLTEAIRYSVFSPGKRIRPALTLLACEMVSGAWQAALPAACAVELVHVYSLIHDDLPSMDDDQLRRGRPTCHVQFDEATACLAGDSLQMLAIELLCQRLSPELAISCCQILSRASGRCHLVGGQMDDLSAEGRFQTGKDVPLHSDRSADRRTMFTPKEGLEFLTSIHRRKTGALIEASLQMGGVIGGANLEQLQRLAMYGQAIGLAFQIIDDCLDLQSTSEQLGKTPMKDFRQGKLTYPGLIGLEGSRKMAMDLVDQACTALSVFGDAASKLERIAQFIVDRKH